MDTNQSFETPKVQVRRAEPQDAQPLRELRLQALQAHPEVFSADYDATAAQSVEMWVERLTNEPKEGREIICVAEAEERLVGMAGLFRSRTPKTRHGATVWGVYVKPEWRGNHLAERLIRQCLSWGREQGITVAKIAVIVENAAAIRCYIRCGFSVYGVEPKAIYWDGAYYDELLLARNL